MARHNRLTKTRKKKGKGGGMTVLLLLLIALIGGFLAVATYKEKKGRNGRREVSTALPALPPKGTPIPYPVERHRLPEKKKEISPLQESYTAADIPVILREKSKKRASRLPPGSLAIVIDDMGSSLQELTALTSLRVPLTFSVIPQLSHATEVAVTAHDRGYEVMVHLPMEPQGYPQRRLEKGGLLLSLSDDEITRQMRRYLDTVPHAAGANNHMGSRFTEDSAKMLPVMQFLRERRLYFLDSKTTPLSVGSSLAHEVGLKSASRNVFLDNVQEIGAIRAQLEQAARIARKRGFAVAICHPHKATIAALSQTLPALSSEGITFVKLSQVVE